jgi:hypothetical protein
MEKVFQGRFHPYEDFIERDALEPLCKLGHSAWLLVKALFSPPNRELAMSSATQYGGVFGETLDPGFLYLYLRF